MPPLGASPSQQREPLAADSREPAQRHWLLVRGSHVLPRIAYLLVNVTGGVIAVGALRHAIQFRLLLQILWDRLFILGRFGLLWLTVPLALVLVVMLAAVQTVVTVWRWWRQEPEEDVFLRLRVLLYVAVACVMFNAFVLSTPETFKGPFRVRFPLLAEISAALAYGVYAVWLLSLPRLRRAVSRGARRTLDIVFINAAVVLILTELALRVLSVFWSTPILITESSPSAIRRESERLQPGALLFGFPINSGGHHDTEFLPRSARKGKTVVSIGDSFSYGVVPHAFHFTTVAENDLRGVEIYNMGYPGLGPSDYLYLLRHDALPLEPDLVTVQIFVGNDVNDGASIAERARWYDADSYLVAVVWYRLQILRRARIANLSGSARANETPAQLSVRYPWLTDPFREPASRAREVYLELELRNARSVSATLKGVYERFFEALTEITDVAGDVPVGFVLIPDEFQVEDDLWTEIVRRSDVPLERDRPQRLVVEWLKANGFPVLDLLPALRAVEPMKDGRRHVYHLQDTHFNARGNVVAGHALARFIDSLLKAPRLPAGSQRAARPPSPALPLPLRLDMGDSTVRQWMVRGWDVAEDAGGRALVWSRGKRSILEVSLPTDGDVRLNFEALPFAFAGSPPQRVTIVLNGTTIGEVPLRPGLQRYSVILPAAALRDSPHTLVFNYAYTRKPADVLRGSPDIRELAVAWYSIDFARESH